MIALAFAALLSLQDEAIEAQVKALSHEDTAVRERATAELLKTPLAKLPVLEKYLKAPDAETGARVRRIMTQVLLSNLGSRKSRFELRPFARKKVMDGWIDAGADPRKPPGGHEACRFHPKAEPDEEEREWVLLEAPCITQEDVKAADVELDSRAGRTFLVEFELKEDGSKKFDRVASTLFKRMPRGRLAIMLDGKILSAPLVQAEKFDGRGVIQGNFSEADAKDIAQALLQGEGLESSMRLEREKDGAEAPEKAVAFIRGVKGLADVTIQADATGLDIAGLVDTQQVDFLALWQSLRERGYRLAPKK